MRLFKNSEKASDKATYTINVTKTSLEIFYLLSGKHYTFFLSISGISVIENRTVFAQKPETHVHKSGKLYYKLTFNYLAFLI